MRFRQLLALPLLLATVALAEGPRIAVVDSKVLFDGYTGTKEAQATYEKQVAQWEQEVADKQKELASMKERFEKQSLMLSDEKKRELAAQFQQKQADLQRLVQDLYGKDGRIAHKYDEFMAPIIERIRAVVQQVAKSEGYDLVLDRAAGALLYVGKDDLDLSTKVLDRMNSEYTGASRSSSTPASSAPAGTTPPAPPAAAPAGN